MAKKRRTYAEALETLKKLDPALAASTERINEICGALNNGVRDAVLKLAHDLNIDPDFAFDCAAGHLQEWIKGTYQRRMKQMGLTTEGK